MRSVTPSGQRADDWICTSIIRFTRPAPFSVEPRRQVKAGVQGVEPCLAVLEAACFPEAHSCNGSRPAGRKHFQFNYFFSSAVQYASLRNFDQHSIRRSCAAYSGLPPRQDGVFPLDHEPVFFSGPDGNRTHHTDFA